MSTSVGSASQRHRWGAGVLWVLAPFGWLAWIWFFQAGAQARRRQWTWVGLAALVLAVVELVAFGLAGSGNNANVAGGVGLAAIVLWVAAIVYGFVVRHQYVRADLAPRRPVGVRTARRPVRADRGRIVGGKAPGRLDLAPGSGDLDAPYRSVRGLASASGPVPAPSRSGQATGPYGAAAWPGAAGRVRYRAGAGRRGVGVALVAGLLLASLVGTVVGAVAAGRHALQAGWLSSAPACPAGTTFGARTDCVMVVQGQLAQTGSITTGSGRDATTTYYVSAFLDAPGGPPVVYQQMAFHAGWQVVNSWSRGTLIEERAVGTRLVSLRRPGQPWLPTSEDPGSNVPIDLALAVLGASLFLALGIPVLVGLRARYLGETGRSKALGRVRAVATGVAAVAVVVNITAAAGVTPLTMLVAALISAVALALLIPGIKQLGRYNISRRLGYPGSVRSSRSAGAAAIRTRSR